MKKFFSLSLAILALTAAIPALAQTQIGDQQANAYFQHCKSKEDPRMSKQSMEAFCACTSAEMQKSMSVEDVITMGGNDQASRYALNKMLLDVYTPCMGYAIEEMVYKQCVDDPKMGAMSGGKSKDKLCNCLTDKTIDWFTTDGRGLMENLLKQNPNLFDPIGPVMDSQPFKSASYNNLMSCM